MSRVIDTTKYAWVVPLKDKKGITNTNSFQKILNESNWKIWVNKIKIWVDKGREFYNKIIKLWHETNVIEMYSAHNKEKSVVAERFNKTSKNEIYKYMT